MYDLTTRVPCTRAACARLAGILGLSSVEAAADLLTAEDEVDSLTVAQFLRLCLVLGADPSQVLSLLLPQADASRVCAASDCPSCADAIRAGLGDLPAAADELGWETDSLAFWIADDRTLGEMPMPAFLGAATHAALSPAALLDAYVLGIHRED